MARLRNKFALITGAARGIGRACAEAMAREGAAVALADIDAPQAEQAAREIAAATGRPTVAIDLDVTDRTAWPRAVAEAERALGALNVLVNNAGVCIPGTVEELTDAQWERTIDIDLKSVFLGCRAALPTLARHGPGAIVNVSSISAMVAGHNFAAYNAAKAGVWMLSKSVALHAARAGYGIRVNSVHPAFIDTAMIDDIVKTGTPAAAREKLARQVPLGRIGTPEDVAWAVVYLASEESRFMTAAEIKLDGGLSAL